MASSQEKARAAKQAERMLTNAGRSWYKIAAVVVRGNRWPGYVNGRTIITAEIPDPSRGPLARKTIAIGYSSDLAEAYERT